MGQSRQRSRSGRGAAARRGGTARWAAVLGGLFALALAAWAGLSVLALLRSERPRGGADEPVAAEPPAHAEIDEASKQRLVEILREDEEQTR
jgi:hypothetical protein